ncbi:beta-lactamase [Cladophialophora psammophila CBS 110553]|uniref:Beta-lactamase n=1 Tax=Cladophialophora psammophila CBS 110553 TaxID=1182543 RepID=W9WZM3_9EURO|nr:beta-lactamase [Cladophialophora psammophila CBS 110553]EXJ73363.1 beta-lactamase [Cladophialophora psammophila CBS 110553]
MADLDEILRRYTDPSTGSVHGATFIAVDSAGNDLYRNSFGSRTVDRSDPLTPDTLTWIASQSKLATSVAAMQVVEKGLIGLDDDVRDVLPVLKDLKVLVGFEVDLDKMKPSGKPILEDVKGKITLRQLMSHTSGFCYDLGSPLLLKWSAATGRTDNMFSGKIEGSLHPLLFQPGESWMYSPGLDWAGQVVEALTKQNLDRYMQENIWGPLGAKSTTFYPTKHFHPEPMPQLHETGQRTNSAESPKALDSESATSPWPISPRDAIGGAGLYGTANDYIKLLSCLLQGGGSLLKKESVDEMFRPQIGKGSTEAFHASIVAGGRDRLWRPSSAATAAATVAAAEEQGSVPGGHCLAGAVNLEDVPGRRRGGTVNWGGLPNLLWWVDREGGVAGTLFNQIIPAGDPLCMDLLVELEEALYRLKEQKA